MIDKFMNTLFEDKAIDDFPFLKEDEEEVVTTQEDAEEPLTEKKEKKPAEKKPKEDPPKEDPPKEKPKPKDAKEKDPAAKDDKADGDLLGGNDESAGKDDGAEEGDDDKDKDGLSDLKTWNFVSSMLSAVNDQTVVLDLLMRTWFHPGLLKFQRKVSEFKETIQEIIEYWDNIEDKKTVIAMMKKCASNLDADFTKLLEQIKKMEEKENEKQTKPNPSDKSQTQ